MGGKTDYCPESVTSVCTGLESRSKQSPNFVVTCDPAADSSTLTNADVVVVAVGGVFGHEGSDRTNISLPQEQQEAINSVLGQISANKVVLVLVNGDPIALDAYKGTIPTIVEALEGGQSGGAGLASVLFGDVSPSGMLPFTVYPDAYVSKVPMSDMSMRANSSTGSPGRTVGPSMHMLVEKR